MPGTEDVKMNLASAVYQRIASLSSNLLPLSPGHEVKLYFPSSLHEGVTMTKFTANATEGLVCESLP